MASNVAIAQEKANSVEHAEFVRVNTRGPTILAINQALRKKFGSKTWASIAFLLKLPERTAKHRLAGTRQYDFADLVNLLRSDAGLDVLKAMMGDKKKWPKWFRTCLRQIKDAKALTDLRQIELRLEQSKREQAEEAAALYSEEA